MIVSMSLGTLSMAGFALVLQEGPRHKGEADTNAILVFTVCCFVGFCMSLPQPLILESATEMTYPFPEEVSSGVIFWAANAFYIALVSFPSAGPGIIRIHRSTLILSSQFRRPVSLRSATWHRLIHRSSFRMPCLGQEMAA